MIIKYFLLDMTIGEWREGRISLCPIFLYKNTCIEMRTWKSLQRFRKSSQAFSHKKISVWDVTVQASLEQNYLIANPGQKVTGI